MGYYYYRFFLASNNDEETQRDQQEVRHVLQAVPDQSEKIAQYFQEKTRKLMVSKSFTVSNKGINMVDIVRDVLRFMPLHWAATEVVCTSDISYSDVAERKMNSDNRPA